MWSLHGATLLFGATALFSHLIPLSALDITVIRCFIAAITLIILFRIQNNRLRLSSFKDYGVALLLGIIMGVHWFTYFAGMQLAGVAIGMISFYTYPLMTVILEPLLHRQLPHWSDLLLGVVGLVGLWLIAEGGKANPDVISGIMTGVFSALLFTLRNLLYRYKFSRYSGPQAMFYQTLVSAIILLPFLSDDWKGIEAKDWGNLVVLGIFFTALSHALYATSLRYLKAKTVSLIACLQPFYSTSLAIIVLSEIPTIQTVIGGCLIVSAAIYETLYGHKRKS
nr:DMT family transporter [Echinimonas agarilytica]